MREGEFTLFGGESCKNVAVCLENMDDGPEIQQMLDDQVKTFGPTCVDPSDFIGIPGRVLVRNARREDFNTGVVRVVTLDEALAGAKAHKVYVLKACE